MCGIVLGSDVDKRAEGDENVTVEEVQSPRKFYVNVPNDDVAVFIPSGRGGMKSGWRDYFYAALSKVWPYCAVVWQNNYFLKKEPSGRRNWKAHGRCRVPDCVDAYIEGDMSLQSDSHTRLAITITGQCKHLQGKQQGEEVPVMRNRLQLRGERRKAFAEWLSETGQQPTEVYYKLLAQMTTEETAAGNLTRSQTPKVLKQAVWEQHRHVHESIFQELQYLSEAFNLTHKGEFVDGYIQDIGVVPFRLSLYVQEQVDAFIADCKEEEGGILHIDATGSVVAKSVSRSTAPIFLSSLVMSRNSAPVLDFLTNRHSGPWLTAILVNFLSDVQRANSGTTIVPRHVVTDFSYALINAVLVACNRMTLSEYLQHAYDVINGNVAVTDALSRCYISICVSHMIKATADKLRKHESDVTKRKFALVVFAALQRCHDLKTATQLYAEA